MTKTIKLPPLVIDAPSNALLQRIVGDGNVSEFIRACIRLGIQASPTFAAQNTDGLVADQICIVNPHGRPKGAKGKPKAKVAEVLGNGNMVNATTVTTSDPNPPALPTTDAPGDNPS